MKRRTVCIYLASWEKMREEQKFINTNYKILYYYFFEKRPKCIKNGIKKSYFEMINDSNSL